MDLTEQVVLLIVLALAVVCDGIGFCESPQYLERGKRGVVQCQLPKSFYGVLWYNTTDYLNNDPIAYMKGTNQVGGTGYDTNEYSISLNGSLIITEVSLQDDRNFTAIVLDSPRDEYSPNSIHVIVTVKPYQTQPHIDGCNANEQFCTKMMKASSLLSCSVTDARPSVELNWYKKTSVTDHLLRSKKNVSLENDLYTTIAKTKYVPNMNENVVYVCKSVSTPLLLKNEHSLVLVRNVLKSFEKSKPKTEFAEYFTSVELLCTTQPALYLLWEKRGPDNRSEDLMQIVSLDNSTFTKFHSFKYNLTDERSLRITEVDFQDEGLYICTFGNGISESVKMFRLQVYVLPDPEDPVIESCTKGRYCSLSVPKTGELTCSVMGIRPMVKLQWETVKPNQNLVINFSALSHKVENNGFNFNVILKSRFHIQDSFSGRIPIRCKAKDPGDFPFNISRDVDLILFQEEESEEANNANEGTATDNERWKMAFLAFLAIPLLVGLIILYGIKRRFPKKKPDEEMSMVEEGQPSAEKKRIFKAELRTKYVKTWGRVFPLPYDNNVSYDINEIFIEGDIENLEKIVQGDFGMIHIWQKLESHNAFLNPRGQIKADIILEGEPGFGKTTLGYQFALDWATQKENSPLRDIDMYILLRLRYLKDVSSIPAAIRKFLLPGNSLLTVEDVRNILYDSNSVVIFLDGYNRFSQGKNANLSFIKDIRTNNICSECQVIVTTKPSCLPVERVDGMARRRLTGFGEASWRKYLRKSVVGNDRGEEERIMQILYDNSLLRDLCQVPLFFALFAQITKELGNFCGDFNTVTTFFQVLIEHFYSKTQIDISGNKDSAISSVCFDGLLNKNGLIWTRQTIRRKLGHSLYEEYLRCGLIKEKVFCKYKEGSQSRNRESDQYEMKVRFYHDVFCEWYAAKKLAKVFKRASTEQCIKYLELINPFDHQYVYRFACAFDSEAAKKIVNNIQRMRYGEKFAILCILEQTGNFTSVKDTIMNICSSPVVIKACDNLFLQRSTVQLLKFAADNKINIECVWLGKTDSTFDVDKESLELRSGVFLPKFDSLRQLSVYDPRRTLSKADFTGFFKYASLCESLRALRFQACVLPFLPLEDLDEAKQIIDEKLITVQWEIPVHERNWYTLDSKSGHWRLQQRDLTMSKEKYDNVVQSFTLSLQQE